MTSIDSRTLIEQARAAAADAATAERAIGLVDLTSLTGEEDEATIEALCRRAIGHRVAAVCIYPKHLRLARGLLADSGVRLAAVANFPHGGDDIMQTADEAAAAVADGADEVDLVAPIASVMEGDIGLVGELVQACRAVVNPSTKLKLILETGVLGEPAIISAAARAAVMAGIDFLKTSTGKAATGATLEAAALLLSVIVEADGRVGLKAAGGIRTTADAASYLHLADAMIGANWATADHFRLGASSLLDDLLRVAGRENGGPSSNHGY